MCAIYNQFASGALGMLRQIGYRWTKDGCFDRFLSASSKPNDESKTVTDESNPNDERVKASDAKKWVREEAVSQAKLSS